MYVIVGVVFFKQKTAYEMRISDWSSDVCSSDLACRLISGRADDRLPFGTSNARSSAASACVGRLNAIAATARERRECMISGLISSHRPAVRPSSRQRGEVGDRAVAVLVDDQRAAARQVGRVGCDAHPPPGGAFQILRDAGQRRAIVDKEPTPPRPDERRVG